MGQPQRLKNLWDSPRTPMWFDLEQQKFGMVPRGNGRNFRG